MANPGVAPQTSCPSTAREGVRLYSSSNGVDGGKASRCGADQADGPAAAVDGPAAPGLGQVADQQVGTLVPLGQPPQRPQCPPDAGVVAAGDVAVEERQQRVDH